MTKQPKTQSKKGAASIYIVIFTTLVIGVVIASFVHLIVSEVARTSSTDLSQSAYDAALAGVEDAKTAILAFGDGAATSTCNGFIGSGKLDRPKNDDGSVALKETKTGNDVELQSYSCVIIDKDLTTYKVRFGGSSNETFTIIRLKPTKNGQVPRKVRLSWSPTKHPSATMNYMGSGSNLLFYPYNNTQYNYSVLELNLTSTDKRLILYPEQGSENQVASASFDSYKNNPIGVKCNKDNSGFVCNADISLGSGYNKTEDYLVVTLPYNQYAVDLQASVLADNGEIIDNDFGQYRIDSTGRANDYYRRVETYVSYNDGIMPAPQYTMATSGGGDESSIKKKFEVTRNCWLTNDNLNGSGYGTSPCNNSSPL